MLRHISETVKIQLRGTLGVLAQTNTPSLDKRRHMMKGCWPAVTFVLCLLCQWGMGARKWQPRHKLTYSRQRKLNRHVTSTQCPSEPLFPISTVSGGNNELLCTNTTTSFQSRVFKQFRTNKVGKWSTHPHCL